MQASCQRRAGAASASGRQASAGPSAASPLLAPPPLRSTAAQRCSAQPAPARGEQRVLRRHLLAGGLVASQLGRPRRAVAAFQDVYVDGDAAAASTSGYTPGPKDPPTYVKAPGRIVASERRRLRRGICRPAPHNPPAPGARRRRRAHAAHRRRALRAAPARPATPGGRQPAAAGPPVAAAAVDSTLTPLSAPPRRRARARNHPAQSATCTATCRRPSSRCKSRACCG